MAHHQRYRRRAAGVKIPAINPSNPTLPQPGDLMVTRDEDANRLTRSRVVFSGTGTITDINGVKCQIDVRDAMLCVQEYDGPIEPELRRELR